MKIFDWISEHFQPTPNYPDMAEAIAGLKALRAACEAKDPELTEALGGLRPSEFWRAWKDKYPDDFPNGGMSLVSDRTVIKPK